MRSTLCLLGCFLCVLLLSCDSVKSSPETDNWPVYTWMGKQTAATRELRNIAQNKVGKHTLNSNVQVTGDEATKIPITFDYELTASGTYVNRCHFTAGATGVADVTSKGTASTVFRPAGSKQAYKLHCGMFVGATITRMESEPLPGMGEDRAAKELCAVAINGETTISWLVKDKGQNYEIPVDFKIECTPKSASILTCTAGTIGEDAVVAAGDKMKEFSCKPKNAWTKKTFSLKCGETTGAAIVQL